MKILETVCAPFSWAKKHCYDGLSATNKKIVVVSGTVLAGLGLLYMHHYFFGGEMSDAKMSKAYGIPLSTLRSDQELNSFLRQPEIGRCLLKNGGVSVDSENVYLSHGGWYKSWQKIKSLVSLESLTCNEKGLVPKGSWTGSLSHGEPAPTEESIEIVNVFNFPNAPHTYLRKVSPGGFFSSPQKESFGFFGSEMIRTPWQAAKALVPQLGRFRQADPFDVQLERFSEVAITRIPVAHSQLPSTENLNGNGWSYYQIFGSLGGDNCATAAVKYLKQAGINLSCGFSNCFTPYGVADAAKKIPNALTYTLRYGKLVQ